MIPASLRVSRNSGSRVRGLLAATVAGALLPGGPSMAYPLTASLMVSGADIGAMKYADTDASQMLEDDARVAEEFDRLMRDGFRTPPQPRKQA